MVLTLRRHDRCSLTEPTVALQFRTKERSDAAPVLTKLPAGTTIEIERPAPDSAGMIQVMHGGVTYAVFATDVRDRAKD